MGSETVAKGNLTAILRQLRRVVVRPAEGGLTDAQLLERFAAQRDEAAFEVLLWRHGPMVLGVGRRMLQNLHDAEDVLQATFLALVRQAGSISRHGSVGCWLYKVAYRTALRARMRQRKHTISVTPVEEMPAPHPASEGAWPDVLPLLDETCCMCGWRGAA
jgi:DNA-directed RNA polymerase specialized sigma24 family protein